MQPIWFIGMRVARVADAVVVGIAVVGVRDVRARVDRVVGPIPILVMHREHDGRVGRHAAELPEPEHLVTTAEQQHDEPARHAGFFFFAVALAFALGPGAGAGATELLRATSLPLR